MSKRFWGILILELILWGAICFFIYSYTLAQQEQPFVTILTPVKGAFSHPVFAQFIASQTLQWDTPARITKLIIPLYIPAYAQQISISLYQDEKLINRWRYPNQQQILDSPSIKYAVFPFIVPTELSGNLKVVFDGSRIPYIDQAFAPGFFIEEQDNNYPNGNYSIASNKKSGDIGMQIISQKTNYELFVEQFSREPLGILAMIFIYSSAFILISYTPVLCMNLGEALVSKTRKR
ncbi:MAG TPA: hypothetical protein VLG69_05065 [Candidatus Andersenbacteria bacterium]|nr:hypothetical protein [Candidatus Andersenbacteria bacterium]